MIQSQRLGAFSAFVMAGAYVVGIGLAFTVLDTSGLHGPAEIVAFQVSHATGIYLWITAIYVVAGVFLIPLALALYDRIAAAGETFRVGARLATAYGLVWATLIIGSGLLHNTGLLETVRV